MTITDWNVVISYFLAFVSEPWILKQFLRQAKNETIIRSQDYTIVLRYIAANPIGKLTWTFKNNACKLDLVFEGNPIVWDFLREEWPYLVERFTLNDRYLGRLPKSICANFNTKFQLNQMEDFFRKYPDAGAGMKYTFIYGWFVEEMLLQVQGQGSKPWRLWRIILFGLKNMKPPFTGGCWRIQPNNSENAMTSYTYTFVIYLLMFMILAIRYFILKE